MHVTMVKKLLRNGQPCDKCSQAEAMLMARGGWSHINRLVLAVEDDPNSVGMRLAAEHKVSVAPFYLVEQDGKVEVVRSTLQLLRRLNLSASSIVGSPDAMPDLDEVEALAPRFAEGDPLETVRWTLNRFGRDCGIAFSGAEDVVLLDMAIKTELPFSAFCLDTGRLHPETYRFIDRVRRHYGIEIRLMAPEAEALQVFVEQKGLFSFYDDGHKECCGVRKVEPLRRALSGYRAWMTGQRRDQSPTRADVPTIQIDSVFAGRDGDLLKLNPLANWSSQQVWDYIRRERVPYNELHERGFKSIGCEPCTRPTSPGQHEREGRWWWEESTQRECGLHVTADDAAAPGARAAAAE